MNRETFIKHFQGFEDEKLRSCAIDVVKSINCFKCLDTSLLWKERDGLPFSSLDGRGHYDVIYCTSCNNGGWKNCAHTNVIIVNDIELFNRHDDNIKSRKLKIQEIAEKKLENIEKYNIEAVEKPKPEPKP